MRTLRVISGLLAAIVGATTCVCAQQIGSNAPTGQAPTMTLTLKSQLVVETVVVKDKKGNFVPGLTAKDFTVTEDGVPQRIRFCEHEELPPTAAPLPVVPTDEEDITIYKRLSRTSIAQEGAAQANGKTRYQSRRLLVLYFDMTAMGPEDQERALFAAEKFVRTQMSPADLISIMRYQGGSVDVLQDFTADRNRLLSILQTLVVGEGQGSSDSIDDASSADTGAAFGQDDSEFNIFNTDRQLSALQTAAKMLAGMNEKKALIYFASGLRLNGVDNQAQLQATMDAAIRAGVTFWPIDARGLVASAPLGDATQGSPGNQGMYSGTAAQAQTDNFQQSQDTMYSLAADTGGKALFDNNDLARGIVQAQQAISDYYILGYYTTNSAQNGRFRRVKITLNNRADVTLAYRQGYYAGKVFAAFNEADKERQLEDALMLGDPITDLTVSMEINYFQLNRAEYYVPMVVKIPGRELVLAKRMGAEHTLIDFVCEIKDELGGITVSNVRDNVNIKLSDASAAQLAHQPVEYDSGFTLTPGKYSIKFLARDDETGRIGTYQTSFVIPNLNREEKRVPISTVVLSAQRVNTKDALYNVEGNKQTAKNDAANPLVKEGMKLIPSVTRVFGTDQVLTVYLQAYEDEQETAARARTEIAQGEKSTVTPKTPSPLIALVSFYKGQKKIFETKPIAALPTPGSRLQTVEFNLSIAAGALATGDYQCQVTVIDPVGRKVAFWRGPVLFVK
ncbi:MAG: VWA domain-containing protein [Acidobacteriaceae bacterium]